MKKTVTVFSLSAFFAATITFLSLKPHNHNLPPVITGAPVLVNYSNGRHVSPSTETAADMILIEKRLRSMTLLHNGKPMKKYRIALGSEPVGKKTSEGDGRTPEGLYIIDRRKADSNYHRALHISYPNEEDKQQAAARGVSPGSDIMIHGLMNGMGWIGKSHTLRDWTLGCIAVTDEEIDEIWQLTPDGTPVKIVP